MGNDEKIIEEIAKKFFSVKEIFRLDDEKEINVCINDKIVSLKKFNDFNKVLLENGFSMEKYGCDWRGSYHTYNTIIVRKC